MKIRNLLFFILVCASSFYGCSPRYLPSPVLRQIDSLYKSHEVKDVIYIRDSVYIKEKGDTVYQYKYQWRDRLVERVDTVISEKIDTMYVEKQVEKPLTKLQQFKMDFADISMIMLLILLIIFIIKKLILRK